MKRLLGSGKTTCESKWWLVGIPLLLSLLVFGQVHRFEPILYDDPSHLLENEQISQGLTTGGIRWALTQTGETNLWHPVTWISFMVDVELFGAGVMGAHHLVNLAFHLVATALFYFVLLRYCRNPWVALFGCCLWAVHPLRAENVAWVSERKDVLCMSFLLGAWWSWLLWRGEKDRWLAWVSLLLFTLSVMSKPSSVGFPLVLLASDYLFREGRARKWSPMLLPFFVVSLGAAVLAVYFQKQGQLSNLDQALPFWERMSRLPYTLWWYLENAVFSKGALWVYPPSHSWALYGKPLLGLGVLLAALFWQRKNAVVRLGLVAFLGFWLPVSGITGVSFYQVAERYAYFIHLGLILLMCSLLVALLEGQRSLTMARVFGIVGVGLTVFSAVATHQRVSYWANDSLRFGREAEINPRSLLAQIFLGILEKEKEEWEQARVHFFKALELDPESGLAAQHAAECSLKLGEVAVGENFYRRAMAAKVLNTGSPFQALATHLYRQGRVGEAKEVLLAGVRRFPEEPLLHLDLAILLYKNEKDYVTALKHYEEVVARAPHILEARAGQAFCLLRLGDEERGREILKSLKTLDPARFGQSSF